MIEDVYEPLAQYRDRFKEEYAKNTAAFFEKMVEASAVDEAANVKTVSKISALKEQIAKSNSSNRNWKLLRALAIFVIVVAIIVIVFFIGHLDSPVIVTSNPGIAWTLFVFLSAIASAYLLRKKILPAIRSINERLSILNDQHANEMQTAWRQLSPLNQRYDWGMFSRIMQQTIPRLVLDPFFSLARLNELKESFGWDDSFNENKSVVFAQSGEINGNPFVLAETLNFEWGTATYTGSLTISWQEREPYINSQGKLRTRIVTRTETLCASVTKPAPVYASQRFLVYGNQAAPDLSFSRSPSRLSASKDSFFDKMNVKREIKKLEKLSRDLDDNSDFTIMSNKEFDAIFHSIDRTHEVQYRVLFTPLAQQQMVQLLKDKEIGFGDDFHFVKKGMINSIHPAHINSIDITAAPDLFKNYNLTNARKFFNSYSNDYFKHFYFALAPLLAIPIYQQHRSRSNIYDSTHSKTSSFWEHESIANFYGQNTFRHPSSITQNILKIHSGHAGNLEVTAHGFCGEDRIDYIEKHGGDGKWHKIPVRWTEFLPVQRTTRMAIRETDDISHQDFEHKIQTDSEWNAFVNGANGDNIVFRRSIASVLNAN